MAIERISAAVARIDCSDAIHTLLWRDGRLELPDHADPEAERALAALGGDPCRCIELLDVWTQCSSDPRVLVLGPREPRVVSPNPENGARTAVPRYQPSLSRTSYGGSRSVARLRSTGGGSPAPESPSDPLLELLSLPGPVPHRLTASVAQSLLERTREPTLSPLLEAALYGRVLSALARWLSDLPALELEMIGADASPSLTRVGDGLVARLPFAWLVDVWAPGLETVAGRFTLAAEFDPSHGWKLLTIDQTMAVNACRLAPQ